MDLAFDRVHTEDFLQDRLTYLPALQTYWLQSSLRLLMESTSQLFQGRVLRLLEESRLHQNVILQATPLP